MLKAVRNPQGKWIRFEYDALGRRTAKIVNTKIYRYLWDGNVLLHEWFYENERRPKVISDELGMLMLEQPEPVENLTTWVYEEGSLVPTAKLSEGKSYSIVSDYLGRPAQAYDDKGELVWQVEFDIYGRIRENLFNNKSFIPFRQLGQYEDKELDGLYYNRFRYYDSNTGTYISQDPIGLAGNNPNFYAYVSDSNAGIDPFGLMLILPTPTNSNPWMFGTKIESIIVPKGGMIVNMAMAPGQIKPGGWGTLDHIKDVSYVRNKLAVTPEFKPEVSHVQKFLIPEGTRVQIGTVGPQTYNGITYEGGGNQVQILNYEDRAKLIPIEEPKKITCP
ncbi:RHS repeat domain-containing protein [Gilliamella sp. G0441]|uniref:RHS repeat domain-containing protein n=1 Tax=Gilliamella sp. G0441 TaxID=3384760 RepID=UPI003D351139